MSIQEIIEIVNGEVISNRDAALETIDCAFASDLMSDVLTVRNHETLMLITGLTNLQTIRTCEMSDIKHILFVRGKEVTDEMKALADENDILLFRTKYSLYRTAGLLFGAGLKPVY
jgi:predicted transcriptional regulator